MLPSFVEVLDVTTTRLYTHCADPTIAVLLDPNQEQWTVECFYEKDLISFVGRGLVLEHLPSINEHLHLTSVPSTLTYEIFSSR